MPVLFTADDVKAIAALAQLDLEPDEIDLFARQLSEFLGYATDVLAVDTAGVAPTAYVGSSQTVDRLDEVRTSLDREVALASAPDPAREVGLFKVPRVIG
jgi:aspartyl-tRNA(Asn)/glutamyl-tRNA(Gln) amidotransferase subunit C